MGANFIPFDNEILNQFQCLDVEKLGADAGDAPLLESGVIEIVGQTAGKFQEIAFDVLTHLGTGQIAETKGIGQKQPALVKKDLTELTAIEIFQPPIIFPPESGNGRRPDLAFPPPQGCSEPPERDWPDWERDRYWCGYRLDSACP